MFVFPREYWFSRKAYIQSKATNHNSKPLIFCDTINNSNETEWCAVWSEIIRVISSASSIWNQKYDFRPKLHDTKFNYFLLQPFWNGRIQSVPIFHLSSSRFVESGNKKAFTMYFVFETEIIRFRGKIIRFRAWMMRFRAKNRWVVNKSHCWEPIRLRGSPVISKWI